MSPKKKASKKKATNKLKSRCECGQSLSYVDRANGKCPSCGEKV